MVELIQLAREDIVVPVIDKCQEKCTYTLTTYQALCYKEKKCCESYQNVVREYNALGSTPQILRVRFGCCQRE